MARQSTTPVTFTKSTRRDTAVLMSSARAGVVVPVSFIPLFPGDSASGRVGVDIELKEMPKPLLNGVSANVQAWFVPKSAHPQYPGRDELMHSMTGEAIKSLGVDDRTPPAFFTLLNGAARTTAAASDFFRVLGLHVPVNAPLNSDLIDAFSVIYNFRLAAHSSRLQRRKYAAEDIDEATSLPRAFWPSSRLSRVVPDYERALILGNFDLDIAMGRVEIFGDATVSFGAGGAATVVRRSDGTRHSGSGDFLYVTSDPGAGSIFDNGDNSAGALTIGIDGNPTVDTSQLFGMIQQNANGQSSIGVTLADIDKARTTQAFAKLRTAYAGNDATGFDNDDTIVALLMQGINVPADQFKRPWLLDSQRVPIGFAERFATDAANLDQSVTLGRASAQLSLNVPVQDVSGVIVVTVEVLPNGSMNACRMNGCCRTISTIFRTLSAIFSAWSRSIAFPIGASMPSMASRTRCMAMNR